MIDGATSVRVGDHHHSRQRLPHSQVPPGARHDRLVSGVDLAPTLLDLPGLPALDGVEGQSFAAVARGLAADGPFDEGFDVPHTTVHTGTIQGGTALNIVPRECRLEFEIRHLPDDDPEALFDEIRRHAEETLEPRRHAVSRECGFAWREMSAFPGLDTRAEAPVAVTRVRRSIQRVWSRMGRSTAFA